MVFHLSNVFEIFSVPKNQDPYREPVYNCANLSCQELSKEMKMNSCSEWVIVSACGAGPKSIDMYSSTALELSFTTNGTVGTEADSAQGSTLWEWDYLPGLIEGLEISKCGSESVPNLGCWVGEAQGPWNALAMDRAQLEIEEEMPQTDGAQPLENIGADKDYFLEEVEEMHEEGLGSLALFLDTLQAFGL